MTAAVAITMGDPAGIGPEIVARAARELDEPARARLLVFGDRGALDQAGGLPTGVALREVTTLTADERRPGVPCAAGARASRAYLDAAVAAARAGDVAGLATAPIHKKQVQSVGFAFPGHTEYLADAFAARECAMMFAGPKLKVALATVHIGLAQVPGALSIDRVASVGALLDAALRADFGVTAPRIGIVGLNPHAGEDGLFGDEERRIIAPAVAALQDRGVDARGPLVPDVAFRSAVDGAVDGLVAMYHDQGLIPVKLVDFERAVNVTLGLPVVRTSPDHGTAYDIAGRGTARAGSMRCAIELALSMTDSRKAP